MPAPAEQGLVRLGRGGIVARTSIGPVQFGAPPETIKDSLAAGIGVPSIYVMPFVWFRREDGIPFAEIEFPIYYNYFLNGRRTTAVCDADGRRRLSAVLSESLFGPEAYDLARDYASGVSPAARADLARESDWFRRKPGTGERIVLSDLVEFALYDSDGAAHVGPLEIQRVHGDEGPVGWHLRDGGVPVADISDVGPAPAVTPPPGVVPAAFAPPAFGLTVLGSSHGFDPSGSTSGFVVWVQGRGILVDPPSHATGTLQAAGVPARQVDTVILTHCHADHDAGVFKKVLEEGRVTLYTTPTILGSFLRKYVALTGESEERLRRLFLFRPVSIGAPQRIHGAEFRFFYSLHSIPTIGFECFFGGKSLVYPSDTMYDPPRIEAMAREGILSQRRRDALIAFPWYHSLVLHEAGLPPIHTPVERLAELPQMVKNRLRLVHIAAGDVPPDRGLTLARTGFDATIELAVATPRHAEALEALDALVGIDLFRDLPIERAREFLTIARRETWPPGALLIGQGEEGDRFYIVVRGEAAVVKDGAVLKSYGPGDFFGETALVTGGPRSADVRAKSELVVLAIDRLDFLSFLRGTDLAEALVRLARNRDLPSWDLMTENGALRALSAAQRTQLQAILEPVEVKAGDTLWRESPPGDAAWLLDSAVVDLIDGGRTVATLGRAAFIGDVEGILPRAAASGAAPGEALARVKRAGLAFRFAPASLAAFLENNPRLLLSLSGLLWVE